LAFDCCKNLTSVTFQSAGVSLADGYYYAFPGDLRRKYIAGGMGTYTRESGGDVWTMFELNEGVLG